MRKIELDMVHAVRGHRNLKAANTTVNSYPDHGAAEVRLHGNVIAVLSHGKYLTLSNAGWATPTTKSRLNALLSGLCAGVYIQQVKGVWWIVDTNTKERVEFYNGVQVEVIV